jgi:hypothetical protein
MNAIFDSVFASYNSFFISTLRKTVDANEASDFFETARKKGVNDSYLMTIVKAVTDNGHIALKNLV